MPLAPGERLGPFEIVAPLGAGNMGEVYRARDVRLDRNVAVKVLLPALAADAEAVARFATEARAVAALSHPNIVALFDVGQDGTTAYVVTELLEGETLRERLRAGPVPVRKAVDYARQIADAIAAAHHRGIVHRDLKPENIFVAAGGRIKVFDFGIAQMTAPAVSGDAVTLAHTADPSAPGSVFGSVGYMAPEQVRGAAVDHRADIFALGCILYEAVSGRRPFGGTTAADSVAALLNAEPPPIGESFGAPPGLDRIIRRCLEKSPDERFQSARDLAFALDAVLADDGRGAGRDAAAPSRGRWVLAGLAAALGLIAVAAAIALRGRNVPPSSAPAPMVRFGIMATTTWSDAASISPDGRFIVYTGGSSSVTSTASAASTSAGGGPRGSIPVSGRFWLRALDSLESVRLSDTEAAVPLFFWSPDSRSVGYSGGNSLILRELPDGAPRPLTDLPSAPQGIAWGSRGDLLVATAEGIYRMPASGGSRQLLLRTEPGREIWRGSPAFLPGGERFLFSVLTNGSGEQALETRVASIDGRELATIMRGAIGPTYVDGYLLFGAGGALYAQGFDADRLTLSGERIQIAQTVAQDWRTGRLAARSSDNGILVIRRAPRGDAQFTLFDRFGRAIRTIGAPDSYTNFSLSPDDRRLVSARRDPLTGRTSLWLIDVARGVTSLIMDPNDVEDADDPTWAPDGRHIAFRHGARLVMRLANGGQERTLVEAEAYPDAFSADGRFLVYGRARGNVFEDWALDVTTPGAQPTALVTGVTLADEGRFSPDGRWLAYHSNETGKAEVSVMPFPRTGEKWQVSQNGGVQPRWSADGNELFYLDPDGKLMSVRMPSSDPRKASAPSTLFSTGLVPSDALDQYASVRDGFVVRAPVSAGSHDAAVHVIVNWRGIVASR